MCHPTRCRTCGKTTWSGCGAHVAQVRATVPADQWCPGHQNTNRDNWIRRLLNG
ncbi:hypothetical protein [Nocardia aurantiaca]|uniref:hypothetical protein n=1 Tax=Nocardia aurantiaca TaxID=2675850 RepID=UPI0018A8A782|nr:hypothetical protein [Nocardia aurantiaca]